MKQIFFALGLSVLTGFPAFSQSAAGPEPLTCLLAPNLSSNIGSDRGGIVLEVPVSRADLVQKGDPLVRVDAQRVEAELRLTEITIAALSAQLERAERLSQRNLIPADELEKLQTDLLLAQAEADRARLELERSFIRAPFSGIVISVDVSPGELIGSDPLVRLVDISSLKAEMIFLDGAFGQITAGQEVELAIDLTGAVVSGRIQAIDPILDPASNTFSVSADVANPDLALPAGVSCRVQGWR